MLTHPWGFPFALSQDICQALPRYLLFTRMFLGYTELSDCSDDKLLSGSTDKVNT